MLFSFFVAMVVAPWLMLRLVPTTASAPTGHDQHGDGLLGPIYRRLAAPVIRSRRSAWIFLLGVGFATLAVLVLFATKSVTVKLLPFDNKSGLAVGFVGLVVGSLLVLTLLGSQVSGILSTVGSSISGPVGGGVVSVPDGGAPGANTGGSEGAGSGAGNIVSAIPRAEPLIIKTGNLTLEVEAIDAALTAATNHIGALGGYASGSERAGAGRDAQATITFRVPAERWDDARNGLSELAVEVLAERSSTEDVTGQVVDLGARVRNLQATEAALQAIMNQATVVKDVLAIQAELTTVRGQIEQLTAQKTHLEEQAAYSTLTATFVLEPTLVVTQKAQFDPSTEVDAASAKFVSIVQRVVTAGIWFAIVWLPILLVLGIIVGVGLFISRRVRGSTRPPAPPAAPAGEGAA
jgi:hypothetical protein